VGLIQFREVTHGPVGGWIEIGLREMQDVSVNKHKLLKNRTLSETCNVRVKILKLMAQDGNVVLCLVDLKMENPPRKGGGRDFP